jgi:hypothetical protein
VYRLDVCFVHTCGLGDGFDKRMDGMDQHRVLPGPRSGHGNLAPRADDVSWALQVMLPLSLR